ncbi:ABC transporter substrate-binding protein, partial [Paenibacillus sp. AR247]|uniref:ABC transporter substrate-binding protein n=2 Tax=Paenibacillus TaxID=44249 RepID=UPI000D43F3D6
LWVTGKDIYVSSDHLSSGSVLYDDLGLAKPKLVEELSKTGTVSWNQVSLEKFAQMDADYLFIVNSRGVSKDELLKDPVWANIPAVKEGHVYEFDDHSSWLYSGTIANTQIIDDVLSNVVK